MERNCKNLILLMLAIFCLFSCKERSSFNNEEEINKWLDNIKIQAEENYKNSNKDYDVYENIDEIKLGKDDITKQSAQQSQPNNKKQKNIIGEEKALKKDRQAINLPSTPSITVENGYNAIFDNDYVYFYTDDGLLYKKIDKYGKVIYKDKAYNNYDSFPAIGYGNELVNVGNNNIVIKHNFSNKDEEAFVYKVYNNSGICYDTRLPDGTELNPAAFDTVTYNGIRYITFFGGALNDYIIIDENLGSGGTLKAYIRGEYNNTINKEVLFNRLKLTKTEGMIENIKSVTNYGINKILYEIADENSTKYVDSENEELNYLVSLLNGGYINPQKSIISGNISTLFTNPYTKKGIRQLEDNELFLVTDSNKISYIMSEEQILNYLKEVFEAFYNDKDNPKKSSYLDAFRNFRIQRGNEEKITELKYTQEQYVYTYYMVENGAKL